MHRYFFALTIFFMALSAQAASWDQVWRVNKNTGVATLLDGSDLIAVDVVSGNEWRVHDDGSVFYNNTFVIQLDTAGEIVNLDARTTRFAYVRDDQGFIWNVNSWDNEATNYGQFNLSQSDQGYDEPGLWWIDHDGEVSTRRENELEFRRLQTSIFDAVEIDSVTDEFAYVYDAQGQIWGVDMLANTVSLQNLDWAGSDHSYDGYWIAENDGSILWNGVEIANLAGNGTIEGIDGGRNDFAYVYVTGTPVPVPAAVWLFGSALVGLGWLRRKS